jgi:hypothetical protein
MNEQDVFDELRYDISYDEYGNKSYRNKEGKIHRDEGPAIIWANGSQIWYRNGKRHREDGPAIIWANGSQEWFLNGKRIADL